MKSAAPLPSEKQCGGTCKRVLPLSEFGVNNARADLHSLYCHDCTNRMVAVHRQNAKVYNELKEQRKRAREREERQAAEAAALSACEVNSNGAHHGIEMLITSRPSHLCQPCSPYCQEWLWHGVINSRLIAPRL